jgi:hypothetical protein
VINNVNLDEESKLYAIAESKTVTPSKALIMIKKDMEKAMV